MAILDAQLADQQARADNLNEFRKELDQLEAQVAEGLIAVPEAEAEVKALRAKAAPSVPIKAAFPTLPPEGSFEGAEGQRLRRTIADTEARIAQLDKVLGELRTLDSRRELLKQELQLIEAKRGAAK
ncbi:MAG: hypothetical protein QM817_13320 [Archangium sp.]